MKYLKYVFALLAALFFVGLRTRKTEVVDTEVKADLKTEEVTAEITKINNEKPTPKYEGNGDLKQIVDDYNKE